MVSFSLRMFITTFCISEVSYFEFETAAMRGAVISYDAFMPK